MVAHICKLSYSWGLRFEASPASQWVRPLSQSTSHIQWFMPVIPTTWEAEVRRSRSRPALAKIQQYLKIAKAKRAGHPGRVPACLACGRPWIQTPVKQKKIKGDLKSGRDIPHPWTRSFSNCQDANSWGEHWWLTPVVLPIQETEIRRTTVRSQPGK
jgi:hypothetical protein